MGASSGPSPSPGPFREPRAVIWDIDGTLMDSEPLFRRALVAVTLRYGLDISALPEATFVGVDLPGVWHRIKKLEPGLSALIPMSELGIGRDEDPTEIFKPGEPVTTKILSIDGGRQRMSLSVKAHKRDQERAEYAGHMDSGSDEPSMTGFGAALMNALEKKKK